MVYYHLTTLDKEVQLFWKPASAVGSAIFFTNRYLMLGYQILFPVAYTPLFSEVRRAILVDIKSVAN